jgi:uncharacterized protein YndB with AHSA1/START domain
MTTQARAVIQVSADLGVCWRAWTEANALRRWYAERVRGDVVPGQHIDLEWASLGQSLSLRVEAAEPAEYLRLSAELPSKPPQTLEVWLRARADGCEVEVAHRGFREGLGGEDERAGSEAGWRAALAMLALSVDRYPGHDRAGASALTTAAAAPATCYSVMAALVGLRGEAAAGDRCPTPIPGVDLSGVVLISASPHYLLIELPGIRGALGLRTFPVGAIEAPESAILAAHLWSWGGSEGKLEALRPALEALIGRVAASLGGPAAEA